jgi:hypothetical protein
MCVMYRVMFKAFTQKRINYRRLHSLVSVGSSAASRSRRSINLKARSGRDLAISVEFIGRSDSSFSLVGSETGVPLPIRAGICLLVLYIQTDSGVRPSSSKLLSFMDR